MRIGIPAYRLPRAMLEREIEFIRWLGVEIRLGVRRSATRSASPIWCATSTPSSWRPAAGAARRSRSPAPSSRGVLTAIDLLAHVNLGQPIDVGQRVVVVGGGNVAYDAARSARRFGGTSEPDEEAHNLAVDAAVVAARVLGREVTMVTLESRQEMPADPSEIAEGAEEGVRLVNRRGPKEILGEGGRVTALRTIDVARVFDEQRPLRARVRARQREGDRRATRSSSPSGRWPTSASSATTTASQLTPQGLIAVDPATLATSRAGVFAGGDIAFGPRIVISAVADGRRAARAIDTHLTGRRDEPVRYRLRVFPTFGYEHPFARGDYETVPRAEVPVIPVERRTGAAEVERVLSDAEARAEGSRCLHCWVNTVFDSSAINGSECIQCGGCVDVCPEQCIDLVALRRLSAAPGGPALRLPDGTPLELTGQTGAALLKDETACIRCGLCARRCPTGVITMQALYREDEAALVPPRRLGAVRRSHAAVRRSQAALVRGGAVATQASSARSPAARSRSPALGTGVAAIKFLEPPRAVRGGHARHRRPARGDRGRHGAGAAQAKALRGAHRRGLLRALVGVHAPRLHDPLRARSRADRLPVPRQPLPSRRRGQARAGAAPAAAPRRSPSSAAWSSSIAASAWRPTRCSKVA